jgi:predicted nuclease of predicted toxin-antitoxin system
MRFLVDGCTGPKVAQWLRKQNFEVFSVFDDARGINDDKIIEKAYTGNWILITNDKDFREKVYREGFPHKGIIFLRLEDERASVKIETLRQLLKNYKDELENNFVVVTETKVRFARKYNFNKK